MVVKGEMNIFHGLFSISYCFRGVLLLLDVCKIHSLSLTKSNKIVSTSRAHREHLIPELDTSSRSNFMSTVKSYVHTYETSWELHISNLTLWMIFVIIFVQHFNLSYRHILDIAIFSIIIQKNIVDRRRRLWGNFALKSRILVHFQLNSPFWLVMWFRRWNWQ